MNGSKFKIPVNEGRNRQNLLTTGTSSKNKSFEKVSVSDLKHNLSKIRS